MNRKVYRERRTFMIYDDTHIIGYLNEEVIDNYVPEDVMRSDDSEDKPEPWEKAYAYTGTEKDGGCIMPCDDPKKVGKLANAIIRSRYREDEELAIQRHAINGDYSDGSKEYEEYNAWCVEAVATAKRWLGVEE